MNISNKSRRQRIREQIVKKKKKKKKITRKKKTNRPSETFA